MSPNLSAATQAAMSAFPSNPCRSGEWGAAKVCVAHPGWGVWDEEADACPLVARIVHAAYPVIRERVIHEACQAVLAEAIVYEGEDQYGLAATLLAVVEYRLRPLLPSRDGARGRRGRITFNRPT